MFFLLVAAMSGPPVKYCRMGRVDSPPACVSNKLYMEMPPFRAAGKK
jgi:hypothetical protein